ncbi:hypothetical protein J2TS4_12360 [Paenibacillus sp. J2TS4]|nr:hypothetical protein J2TS4_12360 [Paenibacillus sp. J2TS4]
MYCQKFNEKMSGSLSAELKENQLLMKFQILVYIIYIIGLNNKFGVNVYRLSLMRLTLPECCW